MDFEEVLEQHEKLNNPEKFVGTLTEAKVDTLWNEFKASLNEEDREKVAKDEKLFKELAVGQGKDFFA